MSFLTKLFVVLVTVLAIVLVSIVVPFVANTENYKQQITALETKVKGLNAIARKDQTRRDIEQNARKKIKEELQSTKGVPSGSTADATSPRPWSRRWTSWPRPGRGSPPRRRSRPSWSICSATTPADPRRCTWPGA